MVLSNLLLAAETATTVTTEGGFMLRNAWVIPLVPFVSFWLILFVGKRLPAKGAEIGIAAVGIAFVLAVITGVQWIDHRDNYEAPGHSEPVEEALAEPAAAEGAIQPVAYTAGDTSEHAADELAAEEGEEGEEEHPSVAVGNNIDWLENGGTPLKVGFLVDGLAAMMLFVVTTVSLLVHVYSTDYVAGDKRYTHFFAFLSLFTASMLFLVLAENTLQLIVGWELVGVCSFVLIGHWWEDKPNSDAALKAFLTNRVGDVGLLVGVIILFFTAGNTFNIVEINAKAVAGDISHTALLVASVALTAAVMSKSGQFVLHTWLPDAMAGPTPVSALIHAATMVVAGVYMVARLYPVFFEGFSIAGSSINLLAVVGAVTLFFGGLLAFVQNDIKKVLAYSTVSQLGYMVMALGVGAWTAAVFHLFTHAFFKAGLFLGSGSVSHSVHSFDMKTHMGGLRRYMPVTFWTFIVCSLALMGIFPLAGFWSKDEILAGSGGWGFMGGTGGNGAYTFMLVMGVLGAALTAAYMTRCIYLTFFGEWRGAAHVHDHGHGGDLEAEHIEADEAAAHHDVHHGLPHESGPRITVPLVILAALAVLSGFVNLPPGFQLVSEGWTERFGHFVEPVSDYFPEIAHATPSWTLAIFSTLVALSGVAAAGWYYFVKVQQASEAAGHSVTELANGPTSVSPTLRAGHTLLVNKYYLDHLYTDVIVGTTKGPIADASYWVNQNVIDQVVNTAGEVSVSVGKFTYDQFDQRVVDGLVNGSGEASEASGEELRKIQTGKVQQYAALLFVGAAVLAGLFMILI